MFTKYRPGLFTQMLAVEDGEMSQNMNFYNSTTIYLPQQGCPQQKGGIAAWYETWFYE